MVEESTSSVPVPPNVLLAKFVPNTIGFHAAEGDPSNLKLCQRGEWNDRMLIETVLSMLTVISHFKKVLHRVWEYFQARLAFTLAMFKLLVQWYGLPANESLAARLAKPVETCGQILVFTTSRLSEFVQTAGSLSAKSVETWRVCGQWPCYLRANPI